MYNKVIMLWITSTFSLFLVFALSILCLARGGFHGDVTVNTTHGLVLGYSLNLSGSKSVQSEVDGLNVFLGIPFAEPPTGELRFARPVPKTPWTPSVMNATTVPPICPQTLGQVRSWSLGPHFNNSSEDCLYLNIYSPTSSRYPHQYYPVLFWVHGGAYKYGSGIEYDGRILAQEGVVVVTFNYRLGILGFLSTDDDVAPGNYGLLDQVLALNWTKNNIEMFGGDPNRITIFGQSAGGGSVSLQMFSPLSKGLFQSVIPQSGCALSPWAIYRPPHNISTYTKILAQKLGCPRGSSTTMVHCLRGKSADDLILTSTGGPPMISTWAPRVDGYFIKDLPEVLLDNGEYHENVTVMTGYVPQELSEDLGSVPGISNGLTKKEVEENFYSKSRRYLARADDMYSALLCAYPPTDHDVFENRETVIDMNSDYGYVAPHIKMAEKLSADGVKVWLYDFTYRSQNSIHPEWMGVPHAEELYFQFGSPFLYNTPCPGQGTAICPCTWVSYQTWSQTDVEVSKTTMAVWAAFAKQSAVSDVIQVSHPALRWPRFTTGGFMLNITDKPYTARLVKTRGVQFWNSFNYLNLSSVIPNSCHSSIVG